ncbi:uncharacterized protein LOC128768186 isoform X2 [Synchiropus splendidus]|uniref:uncharacterized protein LOC128768186 isoform X2 n=1 Tax=Synchiropus splendidus TaxID=270530 RepID=UPI00237E3543|nr:uncharacterized protein LOC128768186 isoform X2 [Synchiropus splendidus]
MSPQSTTWFFVYTSLLFSFLGINSASDGSIRYSTVGSSVVLSPNSDVKHFSSLTWKIGPDLAMEWYGTEVFAYRQFKERGMLNTTSGEMTISGLTPADSGLYTAITNDIHTNRTRLEVIYNVPKPTLSVSCDTRDKCLLACGGNTSGAGPVSFSWDVDGLVLDGLPTEIVLTEKSTEQSFTCVLSNPVSSARSDTASNPFFRQWYGIYIAVVLYLLAMSLLVTKLLLHL